MPKPELLKGLLEAQFERDHCEPEQRKELSDKLKALLKEAIAEAPDVSEVELLIALNERYRAYSKERIASAKKAGRIE